MLGEVEHFRRAQQRLRRNTSPVKANATQAFALDNGRLHPELARADRRDIATGAGADDDQIITAHSISSRCYSSIASGVST